MYAAFVLCTCTIQLQPPILHVLLCPCMQFGEHMEMEEDDGDANVENYIADFFGHTPDTGAQNVCILMGI